MVRIRAPELSPTFPWLNGSSPLSLKALRGRIVLLDFWTYGCINCLPVTGECRSVAGRETPGLADGIGVDASFSEPSGLSYAGDRLYIADANNHMIRCLNLESLAISTLPLPGLCAPNVCLPPKHNG